MHRGQNPLVVSISHAVGHTPELLGSSRPAPQPQDRLNAPHFIEIGTRLGRQFVLEKHPVDSASYPLCLNEACRVLACLEMAIMLQHLLVVVAAGSYYLRHHQVPLGCSRSFQSSQGLLSISYFQNLDFEAWKPAKSKQGLIQRTKNHYRLFGQGSLLEVAPTELVEHSQTAGD
jgi:hypothetical protein